MPMYRESQGTSKIRKGMHKIEHIHAHAFIHAREHTPSSEPEDSDSLNSSAFRLDDMMAAARTCCCGWDSGLIEK